MQIISDWNDLSLLPLSQTVSAALIKELLQPFEQSEHKAQCFWSENGVQLIYIERTDDLSDIADAIKSVIEMAAEYPEFVVCLAEDYYLLLSITEDSGAGVYLLFHRQSQIDNITHLMEIAESRS
ncbi:hypothetical protein F8538_09695 [Edwardsiella ictaluri]|uniref:hypothetical protein n=1 Tax=Edwardsiella ictaluri TaxID=67780 RepID=UPI0009C04268|nr:hypothetical protein [Edwardsiella ictaluri]ARD38620.1 hypothetical protein B6E78_03745 [Edwardsiella ictaluri]QPW25406.1 hypothetical protein F8538_09695 [Edwardsiella ictaluri]